jgi:hypothetical protein
MPLPQRRLCGVASETGRQPLRAISRLMVERTQAYLELHLQLHPILKRQLLVPSQHATILQQTKKLLHLDSESKQIPPLRCGMTNKGRRRGQTQIPCGNDNQKKVRNDEETKAISERRRGLCRALLS